jgi:hypothetical protein
MSWTNLEMLTAARLPDLYRLVCERAGFPGNAGPPVRDRFVVRSGGEPLGLLAKLLQEALPEDAPELPCYTLEQPFDPRDLAPGEIVVREGYDLPPPIPEELWQTVRVGRVLVFAIERYDEHSKLVSVVWAAVSEEPSCAEEPLRAAVARQVLDFPNGATWQA